jgi:hypothetical protein
MLQKVLKPAIEVLGAQNIAISITYFRPTKKQSIELPSTCTWTSCIIQVNCLESWLYCPGSLCLFFCGVTACTARFTSLCCMESIYRWTSFVNLTELPTLLHLLEFTECTPLVKEPELLGYFSHKHLNCPNLRIRITFYELPCLAAELLAVVSLNCPVVHLNLPKSPPPVLPSLAHMNFPESQPRTATRSTPKLPKVAHQNHIVWVTPACTSLVRAWTVQSCVPQLTI